MTTEFTTCGDLVVLPKSHPAEDRNFELRRIRKHRVLNLIRECETTSRAEIARCTGYNLPNVSSIVEELVRDGLVIESKAVRTARGRRPVPVSLNKDAAAVMGIEIAERETIATLANLSGEIIHRTALPSPVFEQMESQTAWIIEVAESLMSQANGSMPPLAGVAVGIPGLKCISSAPDSTQVTHVDLIRQELLDYFGVPVLVDADSRMRALGSLWFGRGRDFSSFLMVRISHDIGCGIVIEKRICRGAAGSAGEIGHLPLGEQGISCECGGDNCLRNTASGAGLMRLAKKHGLGDIDFHALMDLARGGDVAARQVFDEFASVLARGISATCQLLNPEAVILTGYVAAAEDLFLDRLRREVHCVEAASATAGPEILVCELGNDTGAMGAAAAVLHHIFHVSHLQLEEVF